MKPKTVTEPDLDRYAPVLKRVDVLAKLLDAQFGLPGTQIRFGWDALIGLIPAVGDVLTLLPQLYLVYEAIRLRLPMSILLKMLLNIGIDVLGGMVPVLGDLFDVGFKSNLRNAQLLRQALEQKLTA